ncbi:MAG: DUF1826 domain-containing protein [Hyphomicrobiales bacterium]|nr:DUF1826 domain-containing protein [Hyphomicrobiales bacterium]
MTLVREIVKDAATGVGVADAPEGLSAIQRPGCAAAIWRRYPLPGFQSWIDALEPERLPKARVVLRPENVRDAAFQICDASGTPDCAERAKLIDDTAALADIFAGLMRAPYLRLRFDVVTTNACRKFHIDAVTARLVCTYRGTGTQYGISTDGAEPRRVFTVPTGAPILLRGRLWPERPNSGLLHRSPPIEGTGETRLVLVLDPVADLKSEPDRELMH